MRLRKISTEQVNTAIRRYFDPEALIEVAAGSLAKSETTKIAEAVTTPITIRLDAPNAAWRIQIEAIYQTKENIVVISRLDRGDAMAAQVISTVSDTVEIDSASAELPVKHYVIGKTWDWGDTGEYTRIDGMEAIHKSVDQAEILFSREK
jgi:hypothetical protein